MEARVTNMIVVTAADTQEYFTLEGVFVGKLQGGARVVKEAEPARSASSGGVVVAPPPAEVRRKKLKQQEKDLTLEERLKHEKEHNT